MTATTDAITQTTNGPKTRGTYVLLFWHQITNRDIIRFGGTEFSRRGYAVHAVSCWNAIYEGQGKQEPWNHEQDRPTTMSPKSRAEMGRFLDSLPPDAFILMTVPLMPETVWLFEALGTRRLRYCYANLGNHPSNHCITFLLKRAPLKAAQAIARELKRLISSIISRAKLIHAIGPAYFHLCGPALFIRAGNYRLGYSDFMPWLFRAPIVEVESFDKGWARLASACDTTPVQGPYAVLLDDAMSHHPDWAIEGGMPDDIPEIQADLSYAINRIESDTGLPIIIALHPKANYPEDELTRVFGDRLVFQNRTAELVKGAALVIGHTSTAFSLAVIFKKSTLCIISPRLRNTRDGQGAEFIASWLGSPPLDIGFLRSNPNYTVSVPPINQKSYKRYYDRFIAAPGAIDKPTWSVVADMIGRARI